MKKPTGKLRRQVLSLHQCCPRSLDSPVTCTGHDTSQALRTSAGWIELSKERRDKSSSSQPWLNIRVTEPFVLTLAQVPPQKCCSFG